MTDADFFDYEPSRVRLVDMADATKHLAMHVDPLITMPALPAEAIMPPKRPRPIAHAARRLKDGTGLGMVMLCVLGQQFDALLQQSEWDTPFATRE